MDHVITSGDALGALGFIGAVFVVIGVLIWVLSVYASGFNH